MPLFAEFAIDPSIGVRILLKAVAYGGTLVAVGGLYFRWVFRETPKPLARRIQWLALAAALLAALASVGLLTNRAAFLGGGFEWALDPMLLQTVWASGLGSSVLWRLIGLVAVLVALLPWSSARAVAAVWGTVALGSFLLVGHAAATWLGLAGALLLLVHLVCAAFWIGALWPLAVYSHYADTTATAAVMTRFGMIAVGMVAVLASAGVILAAVLLGGVTSLFTSLYGNLLLVKVTLVGGLLLLAARHKLQLVPALEQEPFSAARLRRSIGVEMVVAALVIVATAALTATASPPAG